MNNFYIPLIVIIIVSRITPRIDQFTYNWLTTEALIINTKAIVSQFDQSNNIIIRHTTVVKSDNPEHPV